MEERTNYHAPQSDSPVPYAAGRVFRVGWLSTRMDIFKAVLIPREQFAKQIDDDSCGVFCLSFLDSIIRGLLIFGRTIQAIVDKLRKDDSFEILLNNTDSSEAIKSE